MPPESSKNDKNNKSNFRDDNLWNYFKDHILDMIAYIFSIVGVLLLFFEPFYAGLIIGGITGMFFTNEIVNFVRAARNKFIDQDYFKELGTHIILIALIIALFISAPGIFLGAAVVVGVKQLLLSQGK